MKKSSIQKLLKVHREVYKEELKMLVEEVLLAECGEDELKSNTSVKYE